MYDEELEKAMLYYLIFQQEEYLLDEEDFVNEQNKKIIKAINELKAEKKEITILSIKSKIKANPKQVLEYISGLGDYIRTSNSESIYNSLVELSKKRKIFRIVKDKQTEILNCEDIDIFIQELVKQINEVEQINEKEKTFVEQVVDTINQIEKNTIEKTDYSLYTRIKRLGQSYLWATQRRINHNRSKTRCRKNNISITNRGIYRK